MEGLLRHGGPQKVRFKDRQLSTFTYIYGRMAQTVERGFQGSRVAKRPRFY